MAIPESQATLKSFFQTGDQPTQQNFADMIDTFFYLYNEMVAAAAAAQAAAESVGDRTEGIPKAWGRARYGQSGNTLTSDGDFNGVWTKTNSGANRLIKFTFDSAPPHATHYLLYRNETGTVISLTQNIAYIEWQVSGNFDCTIELIAFWPDP